MSGHPSHKTINIAFGRYSEETNICKINSICPGKYFSMKISFPVKITSATGNLLHVFPMKISSLSSGNFIMCITFAICTSFAIQRRQK